MKHLVIKISGRVQGVGFRTSAKIKAMELGIFGFARNEPDETVYIEAEGEKEDLEKFLDWCKKGPFFGRVNKVEYEYDSKLINFKNFGIY